MIPLGNIKIIKRAMDYSYNFARGIGRFSFRDKIKYSSKIISRKFKNKTTNPVKKKSSKWKTTIYYFSITVIPLILMIINFSFISEPSKFFSKSGGMNISDMKKFIVIPAIAFLSFIGYITYSMLTARKIKYSKKTKVKHVKIKNQPINTEAEIEH